MVWLHSVNFLVHRAFSLPRMHSRHDQEGNVKSIFLAPNCVSSFEFETCKFPSSSVVSFNWFNWLVWSPHYEVHTLNFSLDFVDLAPNSVANSPNQWDSAEQVVVHVFRNFAIRLCNTFSLHRNCLLTSSTDFPLLTEQEAVGSACT